MDQPTNQQTVESDTTLITPLEFQPYDWMTEAKIYNKNFSLVPSKWLLDNADILVLLFTARNVDKNGVLREFFEYYESAKQVNVPIEVIYIPMDEEKEDFLASFQDQANWFTLLFDDPEILVLKHMYGISCIPYIIVTDTSGNVISYNGIQNLEQYKKNAILSWLPTSNGNLKERVFKDDAAMYGDIWAYKDTSPRLNAKEKKEEKIKRAKNILSTRMTSRSDKVPSKYSEFFNALRGPSNVQEGGCYSQYSASKQLENENH